jgi:hypothetical protein
MERLFRWGVQQVSRIHNLILRLNDRYEIYFSDKELHWVVMGVLGMAFFFLTFLLFKWVEKHFVHSTMIFAFIFTFTNLVVISFALEIGQRITQTGVMEFMDIIYGLWGFIFMFICYLLFLAIAWLIKTSKINQKQATTRADRLE